MHGYPIHLIRKITLLLLAIVALSFISLSTTADAPNPEHVNFFESKIRPLLLDNCVKCHGPKKQKADLRLDSKSAFLKGGESGKLFKSNNPDHSFLIETVRYKSDIQMPPKQKLSDENIALLEQWIKLGAPWGTDKSNTTDKPPVSDWLASLQNFQKNHWSLQPIQNPTPPVTSLSTWTTNSIDQFIAAKLISKKLFPNKPADKLTLIRRAYFDLHGLPPTPDKINNFLNDKSPNAFETLIDQLLASPRYGERWGRYWLDIARYADTRGYALAGVDPRFPYAYTYRDYVINAFNQDKPIDRFMQEQVAADHLGLPENDPAHAALGFITVGRRFLSGHDTIDDRIDLIGRGLLGLTIACSRCHDHKFDPISAKDYYALYGVFSSSREPSLEDLPIIGKTENQAQRKAFEAELAKREAAIPVFYQQHHQRLNEELKANPEPYIIQVSKSWGNHQTKDKNENKALRRGTVQRWQHYIADRIKNNDTIFTLWRDLNNLKPENFEPAALQLLQQIKADQTRHPQYHMQVVDAVLNLKPKSMQDVASAYGILLTQINTKWLQLLKQDPKLTAMPDPAEEQLRSVLYSPESPTTYTLEQAKGELNRKDRNDLKNIQRNIYKLHIDHAGAPPRAMVLRDSPNPHDTKVFIRGDARRQGEIAPRKFPELLSFVSDSPFKKGSGRLELANAIINPKNPLTSRVFVNRVWMHHFGLPIVDTVDDFGTQGDKPTHPLLLDHLATYFMQNKWSLKNLHKYIMLSSAYRQSSTNNPSAQNIDPENRLLWRFTPRRLDFESLRDAMLAASGQIDLEMGGRSIQMFKQATVARRSVYGYIDRQDLPEILRTFGFASPDLSTSRRSNTTVPQQALFVMNNPFTINQASMLANRKDLQAIKSTEDKIRYIYKLVYARNASDTEINFAKQYIESETNLKVSDRWQYAYGKFDFTANKLVSFNKLPYFNGTTWQGGPNVPDPKYHWILLNASGGHTGINHDFSPIRRWTANNTETISIKSAAHHQAPNGDGVHAAIILNGKTVLAQAVVHNKTVTLNLDNIKVNPGDTIDFITHCRADHGWDGFTWAPTLTSDKGHNYNATTDFNSAHALDPWTKLIHALFSSNEFTFIN